MVPKSINFPNNTVCGDKTTKEEMASYGELDITGRDDEKNVPDVIWSYGIQWVNDNKTRYDERWYEV